VPMKKKIAPQSPSSIIWGWYNRSVLAAVPSGSSLTPLIIKIIIIIIIIILLLSNINISAFAMQIKCAFCEIAFLSVNFIKKF
jgi:hypothetical protein